MLGSLVRHSFAAILLAVVVEELGIPLPIPTDVMIVFAGAAVGASLPRFALFFVLLTAASAVGGSGLYAIVRHGGRPLVDRVGRYVRLTPERISCAEALLARGGWGGIALGRAIPGVRFATVIACGLFRVSYPRFVTAHLVGSSVYVAVFLALGAAFGPAVLDRVHPSALGVRLLWLLPLALGLPLLAIWWGRHARPSIAPSRLRSLGATLLGSFAGTTALAATLSTAAIIADLLGISNSLNVPYVFLGWLLDLGLDVDVTFLLLYAVLLTLLVGLGTAYYELELPYLTPRGASTLRQTLGLALLALGLLAMALASAALVTREAPFELWWQTGGPIAVLGLLLGVAAYAVVTVNGHALAIAKTTPAKVVQDASG